MTEWDSDRPPFHACSSQSWKDFLYYNGELASSFFKVLWTVVSSFSVQQGGLWSPERLGLKLIGILYLQLGGRIEMDQQVWEWILVLFIG